MQCFKSTPACVCGMRVVPPICSFNLAHGTFLNQLGGAMSDGWAVFAGFLSGSVFATALGWVKNWLYRPKIATYWGRERGGYVPTTMVDQGSGETFEGRFLRLIVANEGRSTLRGCGAYVTEIRRERTTGRSAVDHEIMQLR
jgi:hypothetical protein